MKAALELLRSRLGPTPRSSPDSAWTETKPADWRTESPRLYHQVTLQRALITYGEVVWGRVALAATDAWEESQAEGPDVAGVVVYSFDQWYDNRPGSLRPIANELASFYGAGGALPARPWHRHIADLMRDGSGVSPTLSRVLPPQMTGARRVLMCPMVLERAHMPQGFLQSNLIPLVAARGGPIRPVRLIPSAVWPTQLRSMWSQR